MAVLVWLRQDLRLSDNPALYHASRDATDIIPIYILDERTPWSMGGAQRWWLHQSLQALQQQFAKAHIQLVLRKGNSKKILEDIIQQYEIEAVYWNRCYEPHYIKRDQQIKSALAEQDIKVHDYNASLLFEPWEVQNKAGKYFKVFTPFYKHCLNNMTPSTAVAKPKLAQQTCMESDTLDDWQLLPTKPDWATGLRDHWKPGEKQAHKQLDRFIKNTSSRYANGRDFPFEENTSRLSPYLHFGEISPRQVWHAIKSVSTIQATLEHTAESFLRQLFWREFSYHLLYHFNGLPKDNFRSKFDNFKWQKNTKLLHAWQQGKTGYPIVDAGMRELWVSGYMHNRVRLIVGSFLTKDLLIHWHEGEQWFWDTLVDADLANNAFGWQWIAGCGADASPYFRIFNPVLQGEKFDPQGEYVKQWLPELKSLPEKYIHQPWNAPIDVLETAGVILGVDYPHPIVNHKQARDEALDRYKKIK